MNETVRWALPLLATGQAQKDVTHNEAVVAIDRLLHLSVISRAHVEPSADPVLGDAYIVPATPGGARAKHANQLVRFVHGGSLPWSPRTGLLAWVADVQQFVVFMGTGWSTGGWPTRGLYSGGRTPFGGPPEAVTPPQGGVNVDVQCRAAVAQLLVALSGQGVII